MRRTIEPCVVEIQAEPLGQAPAQRLLHRHGERARGPHRWRFAGLALLGLRQRPAQERLILGEHRS